MRNGPTNFFAKKAENKVDMTIMLHYLLAVSSICFSLVLNFEEREEFFIDFTEHLKKEGFNKDRILPFIDHIKNAISGIESKSQNS